MKIHWSDLKEFTESNVRKYVDNKAGVYRLSVKLKTGTWKIFYVGKAEDLKKRLLEHLSLKGDNGCINNKIRKFITGFRFAYVVSGEDRRNIEYTMYVKIKPECNQQEPEGIIIDVNLDLK